MPLLSSRRRARLANVTGFTFHCGLGAYLVAASPVVALQLLPAVLYDVAVGIAFLLREPARAAVSSVPARAAAYARTLFLPVYFVMISRGAPETMALTGSQGLLALSGLLLFAGFALSGWALWHLRRSFSIEPQARQLTIGGPYRFVRHPIYAGYVLQYAAFIAARPTPFVVAAVALWGVFAYWSMRYEEQALATAFPEYKDYRARVGAILPRPPRAWWPGHEPSEARHRA